MEHLLLEATDLLGRWSERARDGDAARVEQTLDEALACSFPCSDPIALSCLRERVGALDDAMATLTLHAPPAFACRIGVSVRGIKGRTLPPASA